MDSTRARIAQNKSLMHLKTTHMTVKDLVTALRGCRFNFSNEADLQDGIEEVLTAKGFSFKREHTLVGAGVIDFFLAGGIGVEVKVKGSPILVTRQLLRYAECAEVKELVLVTARSRLGDLPDTLRGKRVTVVSLWEQAL